tara:strand:+ start:755 stop:1672 length:918 start_codon:yes stop_codon:yes gene_type:complete
MTKKTIYLNKPNEDWIVDRFRNEWYEYKKDISTNNILKANNIWLIAPWTWNRISKRLLKKRRVICTIHHIDFTKFDDEIEKDFYARDKYVNVYHAISTKTKNQLSKLTNKEIITIPFWANQDIWFQIEDKEKLKEKYDLNDKGFILGSFQRDTEGSDLKSPKLSKGPDQFLDIVKNYIENNKKIHVVLSGKRRNYLIDSFKKLNIHYSYFEMMSFKDLNELYNCLDLYIVSSRVEGGPQAIIECGLSKVPIISTDVGIANEVLSPESIFDMENFISAVPNTEVAYQNSLKYVIPEGLKKFDGLFE